MLYPAVRIYHYSKTSNNSNEWIQCSGVDLAVGAHLLVDSINVWFLDWHPLFVEGCIDAQG